MEHLTSNCDYPDTRRVVYGEDRATFIPICMTCHRFVEPDPVVRINEYGLEDAPNATCSKCGRTEMHFEGFI